jgi:hypothetical protein
MKVSQNGEPVTDSVTVNLIVLDVYGVDEGKITMRLMIGEAWIDQRLIVQDE